MGEKITPVARVWSFAAVLLGATFILLLAFVVLAVFDVDLPFLADEELPTTKKYTDILADLAVMFTALAIWVEYLRKRQKARKKQRSEPTLNDLAVEVAVLRGRVRRLGGGPDEP